MNNVNKVTPQEVKGTISLPSMPPVHIGGSAVDNNGSIKTSAEFISSLKKAAKDEVFSDFTAYLNQSIR